MSVVSPQGLGGTGAGEVSKEGFQVSCAPPLLTLALSLKDPFCFLYGVAYAPECDRVRHSIPCDV
jgi:hypothetical protein